MSHLRILLLGATGDTGLHVVQQALERGIDVTAVVRNPEKLNEYRDQVRIITGSALDAATLRDAATGCHAALSCIGSPGGFLGRGTTTVYSRTAAALLEALPQTGIRRLLFCTSAGVEPHDPAEPLPYRLIAKPLFLQRSYDDMIIAEKTVRSAVLDWTLVRPARLTNAPATGHYDVSPRLRTPGGHGIPRADLATFLLDQINDTRWIQATPTLTT